MLNQLFVGLQSLVKPAKLWRKPFWLGLEITKKCNSKCRTCPLGDYSKTSPVDQTMTLEQFKHVIDEINPSILSLTGLGETLLNPEYFEMVEYAVSKGCKVYSTSNGTFLKKYAKEICGCGLHELVISMDGYDEDSFKITRGINQFERILEGIEILNKEKKRQNTSLLLGFNIVVQDVNYKYLAGIVEIAHRYKIPLINFLPLDINRGIHNSQEYTVNIDKKSLFTSLKDAAKRANELNISHNIKYWERHFEEIWEKYHLRQDEILSKRPCLHPWSAPFITTAGDILPCCMMVAEKVSFGNIFGKSYMEILNSHKAIRFRKSLLKGEKNFGECRECLITPLHEKAIDMFRRNLLN
jgi:radical SAM protein with 4Fe4S-binding SPASM domain